MRYCDRFQLYIAGGTKDTHGNTGLEQIFGRSTWRNLPPNAVGKQ